MKISDLGEFGLIGRIRKAAAGRGRGVLTGIGDDAAVLAPSPGMALLATTDMLLEGVHFDLATTSFGDLGWKAAAANLSDIAAMGGAPRFALIGLALPARCTAGDVDAFYRGFLRLCGKHGVRLVGGDTCGSRKGLIISVTVLGEARRNEVITRSGARPGDLVFVTGTLGDSAAGLELVRSAEYGVRSKDPSVKKLIKKHLMPVPRVAWGLKIAKAGCASAMIDVSDGLSSDLGHLCEESGAGAVIFADRVPLSRELRSAGLKRSALEYGLHGGEDYELLFTVPPEKEKAFRALRVPATNIGVMVKGRGMRIVSAQGKPMRLAAGGYDHFRRRPAGGPA